MGEGVAFCGPSISVDQVLVPYLLLPSDAHDGGPALDKKSCHEVYDLSTDGVWSEVCQIGTSVVVEAK